jgi:HEAT repeat protein
MNFKAGVRSLLLRADWGGLRELMAADRRLVGALNRLLYDPEAIVRWRAVTGLGLVAREDPFLLELVIGRLLYTLNDDSGSIGWFAPQALGQICAQDPDLVEDVFSVVLSSLELPVFREGVLWAAGRVAAVRPDLVEEAGPAIARCLLDRSPAARGLACRALGRLPRVEAGEALGRLQTDESPFELYEDGELAGRTVGQAAAEAMSRRAAAGGG